MKGLRMSEEQVEAIASDEMEGPTRRNLALDLQDTRNELETLCATIKKHLLQPPRALEDLVMDDHANAIMKKYGWGE